MRTESRHKDLIKQSELPEVDTQEITAQLVALTRSAPLFKSTASRLVTIQDQTIPPTEHHCALISQAPRLGELAARQSDLELEVAGLRGRTTRLLEVLRASNLREAERWTGWEKRLRLIERQMARVMRERED